MTGAPFMPEDFVPPSGLVTPDVVLEPLGPEHNERDYAAWTSSMEHIHATPGFRDEDHDTPAPEGGRWPCPMTLEQNLGDLVRMPRISRPAVASPSPCSTRTATT